MRRRALKQSLTSQNNTDRWLVSYADFITLLFAFFVVMYAVSSISESKYKRFAAHLDASFSNVAKALLPIQFGPIPATLIPVEPINDKPTQGPFSQSSNEYLEEEFVEEAAEVATSLKGLIDDKKILVKETDNWIEIELKANVLFGSASSTLIADVNKIMLPIVTFLQEYHNPIQVEGFSDNVPIQNELFPSNWELSASRAASVTRRLIELGLDSTRLAAVGYGSNFPIRDNATLNGRMANRRVVLLIAKQPRRQRLIELQQRANGESSAVIINPSEIGQGEGSGADDELISITPAQKKALKATYTDEGSVRFSSVPGR